MRVKTSAGDVELTADMVRRGMVFQDPTGAPYKLVRFDPYAVAWSESDGALTEAEVAVARTTTGMLRPCSIGTSAARWTSTLSVAPFGYGRRRRANAC